MSLFIDIILISTPYLPGRQQVVTSNTGPILVFPLIQPFGSDVSSSLGKVYSRHAIEYVNCENSSVSFVMKNCPTSTTVRNPASVKNCSICLVVTTFQFVLRIFAIKILYVQDHPSKACLSSSPLAQTRNSTVLPQRVSRSIEIGSYSSHISATAPKRLS